MIDLRWYQTGLLQQARAAFAHTRRVCIQAPTGSGKTIMFAWLAREISARGKRVLILCHRRELIRQACDKLEMFGIVPGVIVPSSRQITTSPVVVGSIQTIVNRLADYIDQFDIVILDECHHAVSPTWRKVLAALSKARLLGFTATPRRLDGQGLADVFDKLVVGPPVRRLIDEGFLADYIAYGPPHGLPDLSAIRKIGGDYNVGELGEIMSGPVLVGDLVEHYKQRADGMPAIMFGVHIKHIEIAAEQFRNAGFRACHVDGKMDRFERDRRIRGLENGDTQVLTSCELVSEGLDIPAVACAIMGRPTESLAMSLQQTGRVLRPKPDGSRAIILDHAGNIMKHDKPDAVHEWTLTAAGKTADQNPVKCCPECYAYVEAAASKCPECGYSFAAKAAEPAEAPALPKVTDGQLVEYDDSMFGPDGKLRRDRKTINAAVAECETWEQLEAVRKSLGFKAGWSKHTAEALGWEPIRYGSVTVRFRARGTRDSMLAGLARRDQEVSRLGPGSGGYRYPEERQ